MLVENSMEMNAPLEQVYALAKDVYSCPEEFLPGVKSIRVVERSADGKRIVSEWESMVKEFRALVRWTVEDIWDDNAHAYKSSLIKSNYYTYSGHCTFTDLGSGTRVESKIEVDCDLPRVGAHIKRFIANKIHQNINHMFTAIKARVETA